MAVLHGQRLFYRIEQLLPVPEKEKEGKEDNEGTKNRREEPRRGFVEDFCSNRSCLAQGLSSNIGPVKSGKLYPVKNRPAADLLNQRSDSRLPEIGSNGSIKIDSLHHQGLSHQIDRNRNYQEDEKGGKHSCCGSAPLHLISKPMEHRVEDICHGEGHHKGYKEHPGKINKDPQDTDQND